jgi:hypothetical protein
MKKKIKKNKKTKIPTLCFVFPEACRKSPFLELKKNLEAIPKETSK